MKLLKFNLIFIPLLALCLGAVGYIARELLLENARQQVIQNARIMMETALSSRTYTTKQVAPLLQQKNFKLQSAIAELQKDARRTSEDGRRRRGQGRSVQRETRLPPGAAARD